MPTQLKIDEVARLKETLEKATAVVLADYRGLTANEMVELREKFTKVGLEYRVVKDTLARIAADEAGIEGLSELLAGPISVALAYEDPATAFKLSEECRKTYAPRYELKGGVFEGVLVREEEVKRYALLPSREELLAKLAMLLSSPMRALAVMLKAKIRELATALSEVAKKREQEPGGAAEAPAEEAPPPSEEAPEAEASASSEEEQEQDVEESSSEDSGTSDAASAPDEEGDVQEAEEPKDEPEPEDAADEKDTHNAEVEPEEEEQESQEEQEEQEEEE
jgi:large subunit ribosomal protein L10